MYSIWESITELNQGLFSDTKTNKGKICGLSVKWDEKSSQTYVSNTGDTLSTQIPLRRPSRTIVLEFFLSIQDVFFQNELQVF